MFYRTVSYNILPVNPILLNTNRIITGFFLLTKSVSAEILPLLNLKILAYSLCQYYENIFNFCFSLRDLYRVFLGRIIFKEYIIRLL